MRNPFQTALIVFTVIFAVVAGILYIVAASATGAYGEPDPAKQFTFLVSAGSWASFAGISLIATLVVSALIWKPAPVVAPAPREED